MKVRTPIGHMVGGLTASALLVLIVIPVFYDLLERLRLYARRARSQI